MRIILVIYGIMSAIYSESEAIEKGSTSELRQKNC